VVKKRNVGRLLKSGCNEEENEEILKLLFKTYQKKGVMLTPIFVNLFFGIPINSTTFSRFTFANYIQHQPCNMFIYLLCSICRGIVYFSFRNNRLFINDDFIIRQSGAWDVTMKLLSRVRFRRLQRHNCFGKSVDIGSITIHTAGGNISFQLGNFTTIKQYVNLWLYEMETSDSNWM
jgi:putative membrane protein